MLLPDLHKISQEAGQVVWYSNLMKNFPQFIVIHTVKGFVIVVAIIYYDDLYWHYLIMRVYSSWETYMQVRKQQLELDMEQ